MEQGLSCPCVVQRCGGCYKIIKKSKEGGRNEEELAAHRARLTVSPVKPPGWGAPPSFEIYSETDEALLVPRFYAQEYLSQYCEDQAVVEDETIEDRYSAVLRELPFVGELTNMQQEATKKCALFFLILLSPVSYINEDVSRRINRKAEVSYQYFVGYVGYLIQNSGVIVILITLIGRENGVRVVVDISIAM